MPIASSHLTKEEREYEECTFRPKINETCPFVSDRTLRRYAQLQRPPAPPDAEETGSKPTTKPRSRRRPTNLQAGNYKKAQGFVRGPPEHVGMPLFYFDGLNPPNFTLGTYGGKLAEGKVVSSSDDDDEDGEEVEVEVEVTDDDDGDDGEESGEAKGSEKKVLACPPLPPWASGAPMVAAAAAAPKNKIVIQPREKTEKKEEEASGWQAVLAEMQKRANRGGATNLKPPEPVKKEAPKPQKKAKKKKGEFKDVMEELNYKLAVARGEIVEEPDSDEDASVKSKGSAKTPRGGKAGAKAEAKAEEKQDPPAEKKEAPAPIDKAQNKDADGAKAPAASDALKNLFAGKAKDSGADDKSLEDNPKKAPAASDALKALFAGKSAPAEDESKKAPAASDALKALFAGKSKGNDDAPPPIDTSGSDPASASTTPPPSSVYKLNSKPDLNAMLNKAKAQTPAPTPKAEPSENSDKNDKLKAAAALNKLFKAPGESKPEEAAPAKVELKLPLPPAAKPAASAASAPEFARSVAGTPGQDIAVKRPAKVPLAPPLPTAWPPTPYISLVKPSSVPKPPTPNSTPSKPTNKKSMGEKKKGDKKKTKKVMKKVKKSKKDKKDKKDKKPGDKSKSSTGQVIVGGKPLPEGYYIAAPQPDIIKDKIILPAGEITDEMRNKLIQQFLLLTQNGEGGDGDGEDKKHKKKASLDDISNKLSVSDLPIPSSYAATIERLKKAQQLRDETKAKERALELRNYEEPEVESKTKSHTNKTAKCGHLVSNGMIVSINDTTKVTVADDVVFTTDKHYGNKTFTFRKDLTKDGDSQYHSIYETVEDKELSRGNAALLQSYSRATNTATVDRANAMWLNSLRSTDPATSTTPGKSSKIIPTTPSKSEVANSLFTPTTSSKMTKSLSKSNVDSSSNPLYNTVNTMKTNASITKGKAPALKSDQVMEKRKSIREMQQQLEKEHEEKMKQLEKMKKEKLRQQAMSVAASQGAYKPYERHRSHAKILQKYANNTEVVGNLDLVKVTDQALTDYKYGSGASQRMSNSDSLSVYSGNGSMMSSHYSGHHAQQHHPHEYLQDSEDEELYSQYGEDNSSIRHQQQMYAQQQQLYQQQYAQQQAQQHHQHQQQSQPYYQQGHQQHQVRSAQQGYPQQPQPAMQQGYPNQKRGRMDVDELGYRLH